MNNNPYEFKELSEEKTEIVNKKLYVLLHTHRMLYFAFAMLGFFFYWRTDATSLGEVFGWISIIGYLVDIFMNIALDIIYPEN